MLSNHYYLEFIINSVCNTEKTKRDICLRYKKDISHYK